MGAARRRQTRAIMAVAPAIVVSACSRLSRHDPAPEVGAPSGADRPREPLVDRLALQSERLGSRVALEPVGAASCCMFTIV